MPTANLKNDNIDTALELLLRNLAETKPQLKKQLKDPQALNALITGLKNALGDKLSPEAKNTTLMQKITTLIKCMSFNKKHKDLIKDLAIILKPLMRDEKFVQALKLLLKTNPKNPGLEISKLLKQHGHETTAEKLENFLKKRNSLLKAEGLPEPDISYPNLNLLGLVCNIPGCYMANITNNMGNAAGIADVSPYDYLDNLGIINQTSSSIPDYTGRISNTIGEISKELGSNIDQVLDLNGVDNTLHKSHGPFNTNPFNKTLTPK